MATPFKPPKPKPAGPADDGSSAVELAAGILDTESQHRLFMRRAVAVLELTVDTDSAAVRCAWDLARIAICRRLERIARSDLFPTEAVAEAAAAEAARAAEG